MVEKVFVGADNFADLCKKFRRRVSVANYKYVYGVPRGGVFVALFVANNSLLRLIDTLEGFNPKDVLVVDDLVDSGKTKESFEKRGYNVEVLIDKNNDKKYKNKWVEFFYEKTAQDDEGIVVRMLERIGEDPKREGLIDTPKRVVKMWKEIFRGYDAKNKPVITVFDNGKDGILYDEMIVDTGTYYSHCEHHMVPFFGRYVFAYIPDKKIMGISKVARIVDFYSAKLQVQERLTTEIVNEIEKIVQPKGIALYIEGEHLCKTMRGVKKKGMMKTICVRGVFRSKPEARAEFLRMLNGGVSHD